MAHDDLIELSVVVVNYNVRELLLALLESLLNRDQRITLEVIVIDNASRDGSIQALRARFPPADYPMLRVIENAVNVYFSAGYTQGIRLARGRYIIALNADMVVHGSTLAQLVQQIDSAPEVGAATTLMRFPDGTLQRNGSRFPTFGYLLFNYTFVGKLFPARQDAYNRWLWYADWDRASAREIDVLPGSCIIAARETWQRVGGFDARMPMYFSDEYVSRMVQKLGKRTYYFLSDGITHYEGQSAKAVKAWALRMYMHDLLVYTRLVWGSAAQIVLAVLLLPTYIVQRIKARN